MSIFSHIGHALGSVVHAVAKPISSGVGLVAKAAGHVPIVGKGISGVLHLATLGPLHTLDQIAQGARVDHAVLGGIKEQVSGIKDVAPYVQLVISQVPFVGPAANSAISAGLALAQGKTITEAVANSVRENLPGPARQFFDQGQSIVASQINPEAALNSAMAKISSPEGRKAFQVGVAVATAHKAQATAKNTVSASQTALVIEGKKAADSDPMLSAGASILTDDTVRNGFYTACAVMTHHTPKLFYMAILRAQSEQSYLGYKLALGVFVARNEHLAPLEIKAPREQFGYYAAMGLAHVTPKQRQEIMAFLLHDNSARIGVEAAAKSLAHKPWWHRLLVKLHLRHETPALKSA